jgi:RNA polymerase sigma factor (sigma-70 family)
LSGHESDDFMSSARLSLIEDNHARIRAFSGRSSLQTYLVVVITRLFQDWRNSQWGKWRPSAEAKRLGPLAVKLETLTVRDKRSFDEAVEMLRINHGVTEPRAALELLHARFPVRHGRSFTSDEALDTVSAPNAAADAPLAQAEASASARSASSALATAIKALPAQDRLIIRMRFDDGFSVADIAKALKLEPKPLYRRIEKLLFDLRTSLERSGVSAGLVRDAIADRGFDDGAGETRGEVRLFDRGPSPAEVEKVS